MRNNAIMHVCTSTMVKVKCADILVRMIEVKNLFYIGYSM